MSESKSKLDELAWLSLTKPDTASIEALGLTSDDVSEICDLSDSRVSFRDPEYAKERAIRHIQLAVIAPAAKTPSEMFKVLQRCWLASGPTREKNLCGLALARLHNSGEMDALQAAIEAVREGGDAFAVSRVLSASLPFFDGIDVPNLLVLAGLAGPQALLHHAAGEWMKDHPSYHDEIVAGCLAIRSEGLVPLLRTALIRGAAVDRGSWLARIHALVVDSNELVSLPAIEALGLLDWSDARTEDTEKAVEVIRLGLQSSVERRLVAAVGAGLNLVSTAPDQHRLIDEIAALDRPYVVQQIGDHLAYRGEHLKMQPWYQQKIDLLATKSGQGEGAYHGLDHILAARCKSSDKSASLRWLDMWAAANANDTPSFPKRFSELFEALAQDNEALGALLARWLKHDDIGIVKMARSVLDDLGLRERGGLAFPASVLDGMSQPSLLHLVRRMLANVLREEQRISLVWSLTRTDSAESRTYSLVRDAMVNFVGYDYPTATREYLEAVVVKEGQAPAGQLAQQILEAMKEYYDALDALPVIEELRPLSEDRHRFAKEHYRLTNKAFEEASKNSIFRQIATTVHLKAGRSSFSMRNGEVGEKMHMSSMSHFMSLPRSESTDKVGSDLQRLQFNLDKDGGEQ
ncbi:hypothetical protein IMW82_14220 [Rhodanobacter sp. B2A1Ga4]|uniref:hypothetical protein n=1 Tax=Rhodanobacter sp. B2A1Ga4 TaxID=2778647 RepID=UPI001B368A4B|nr:hypothetical protein [Rhodanobacter sp. B2A1Ga4]MBQ4855826.1 hypothetical protein [Rhodanobacter sp. B2A1Ga4]